MIKSFRKDTQNILKYKGNPMIYHQNTEVSNGADRVGPWIHAARDVVSSIWSTDPERVKQLLPLILTQNPVDYLYGLREFIVSPELADFRKKMKGAPGVMRSIMNTQGHRAILDPYLSLKDMLFLTSKHTSHLIRHTWREPGTETWTLVTPAEEKQMVQEKLKQQEVTHAA